MKKKFAKDVIRSMIISEPKNILLYSLAELSDHLSYSEAAIIKGIKALGYDGLKDLKKQLYIKNESLLKKDDGTLLIESILATERSLHDGKSIDEFWKLLNQTKKIVVQGFGFMHAFSSQISNQLRKAGWESQTVEFKEELKYLNSELLIILTTRGQSALNEEIISYAKNKGMKIIVITDKNNSISDKVDLIVPYIHFKSINSEKTLEKTALMTFLVSMLIETETAN